MKTASIRSCPALVLLCLAAAWTGGELCAADTRLLNITGRTDRWQRPKHYASAFRAESACCAGAPGIHDGMCRLSLTPICHHATTVYPASMGGDRCQNGEDLRCAGG
jgi:hypothetical protein